MIAYFDTGCFFDYLIFASHVGVVLREGPRKGREPKTLFSDAEECSLKIAKSHQGITSCHTLYEVENAVFSNLKARAKEIAHAGKMLLYSARPVILQPIRVADLFEIEIRDLSKEMLRAAATEEDFLAGGVKLADTLHMIAAMRNGADLIISGDNDILSYDKKLSNAKGTPIRCLDTDEAKLIL